MIESGEANANLRPARPEDLPAALALLEAAELPVTGVDEWFDRFIVAEHDGSLVGIAGLEVHGNDGLLRSVAVASDWRSHGLGGALTAAILAQSEGAGLSAVYLLTETAEHFFPRYGFTRIEREQASAAIRQSAEFRELCPVSSAVMVRRFAPGSAAHT